MSVRLTPSAYAHGCALALPERLNWRARQVLGAGLQPTRSRSRGGMSGWRRPGSPAHDDSSSAHRPTSHRPRGAGRRGGPGDRLGEGGRPPPRPVALDGQAPSGERPVQGWRGDDGAARVDPGDAAARAGGDGAGGRVALWSTRSRRNPSWADGTTLSASGALGRRRIRSAAIRRPRPHRRATRTPRPGRRRRMVATGP